LTTRPEYCTKPDRPDTRRASLPLFWDVALGLGAVGYVLFALFDGLYSPLMSLIVAGVIAYGLIRPHRRQHR
jgi:hypothetical protein